MLPSLKSVCWRGVAQVGINERSVRSPSCEDLGEIGGNEAASFAVIRTDDGERFAFVVGIEPAQHELAAQGAQLLDDGAEGLVGGDEFSAQALVVSR